MKGGQVKKQGGWKVERWKWRLGREAGGKDWKITRATQAMRRPLQWHPWQRSLLHWHVRCSLHLFFERFGFWMREPWRQS